MSRVLHAEHNSVRYRVRFRSWLPLLTGHDCITIRSTIYTRRSSLHRRTVAHEFFHVRQWQRYGVWGFLRRYLVEQIRHGYRNNALEVEAHIYAHGHETEFPHVSADMPR